eukprot:3282910-Amphidinium_carterae.1
MQGTRFLWQSLWPYPLIWVGLQVSAAHTADCRIRSSCSHQSQQFNLTASAGICPPCVTEQVFKMFQGAAPGLYPKQRPNFCSDINFSDYVTVMRHVTRFCLGSVAPTTCGTSCASDCTNL